MRALLPHLILFAIIISGGFGILRVAFSRHDTVGLLAIVASLVLTSAFARLARSRHPLIRRAMGEAKSKWPVRLPLNACDSFRVFPGRPEGYSSYTDYTAMSVDVNDDLAARQPFEQFALLGFGSGFLEGVQRRIAEGSSAQKVRFRVENASPKQREFLGWLAYLQMSGRDNAGPSTENLGSVVWVVAKEICATGPLTMGFWDKAHNKKNESLEASGTSLDMLEELTGIYQREFREGQQLAINASMTAEPTQERPISRPHP